MSHRCQVCLEGDQLVSDRGPVMVFDQGEVDGVTYTGGQYHKPCASKVGVPEELMQPVTCEGCGEQSTDENPAHPYEDGGHYHDQCAEDCDIPEEEML